MPEYEEFLEHCEEHGLLNSKKSLIGKSAAKKKKKLPLLLKILELLEDMTDWAGELSTANRMRYIRLGVTKEILKCPICKDNRKNSSKDINNGLQVTCGKKDQEHLDYVENFRVEASVQAQVDKYGSRCPMHTVPEIMEKRQATFDEEYDGNPQKIASVNQKRMETQKANNNGVLAFNSEEVTDKTRQITKQRWIEYNQKKVSSLTILPVGVGRQSHLNHDNYAKINKEFLAKNFIDKDGQAMIQELNEFLACSNFLSYGLFKTFGVSFKSKKGTSYPELEIVNFIRELVPGIEIITNSRKIISPKELDIYLPEYNLAIEYNGMMFHSQGIHKHAPFNKPLLPSDKHLIKTELCDNLGINLLHIFESEWINLHQKEQWENIIRNKLKKNTIKLFARKLEVKELEKKDTKEIREFLDKNHMQGSAAIGSIRFGLFHNNILVSLMTFNEAFKEQENSYKLIRFATMVDTNVVGGASKLLKAFERKYNPSRIKSFANRRWSNGNLYRKLGFKLDHKTNPNYFYFEPDSKMVLLHREKFERKKLNELFPDNDRSLNEWQVMFQHGFRRIYDSGSYLFIKDYANES